MTQVDTRTLPAEDEQALVAEVAEALRQGGIVLLPTETVYGLVGRADRPEVVERLRRIKGERQGKPFAELVPDLAAVERRGAIVPPAARRLATRYWPGPLTLVLDDGQGGTRGFRVPGLPFAQRVVAEADVPLVATSANRSGEPPATAFAAAMEALGGEIDLAIDGGDSQLRTASTVVRVAPGAGPPQILREGFLERPSIERALTRLVVFVCTGNTCRSPMAEALFRDKLARRLQVPADRLQELGWQVASAGVAAGWGGPSAANAQEIMRERGLEIGGHQSRPLDADLANDAERIVGLTPSHAAAILGRWPRLANKLELLDPQGVPDPIGGSLAVYRECADHIDGRLDLLLEDWFQRDARQEAPVANDELQADLFPGPGEVPQAYDQGQYDGGLRYLIGGKVLTWSGAKEPVHGVVCDRSADGKLERRLIGETALLTAEVALEALDAASQAWDIGRGYWPRATMAERLGAIRAFCEAIRPRREEVARLLMWEVGKPWESALKEFDRTIEYVDATLEALKVMDREASGFKNDGGVLGMIRRAPLGVVLCMGPFNYPLNETYTTVIPALAMGNTVVIKLPKLGMLCNLPLLEAMAECFPPGVINVISGDGRTIISPIVQSGKVDVLAFIGSSNVAGIIEKQHPAPYRLTTVLGMDAKNPAIVLASADLDEAVAHCLKGSLSFNGQRCTALKILFVHRSLADAFVSKFVAGVEALPYGMPWEEGVALTPLPEPGKADWLRSLVDDAVSKGAEVKNKRGGASQETFFYPAVVYPVSADAELYEVEQFGPIVPIVPFDDVAEVQAYIAASKYGQQVSLFGNDPQELGPLVDAMANQVCRINLNRQCQRGPDSYPFGGRKHSAEGVLSVTDALEVFSLPALVAATDSDAGKGLVEGIIAAKSSNFLRRES